MEWLNKLFGRTPDMPEQYRIVIAPQPESYDVLPNGGIRLTAPSTRMQYEVQGYYGRAVGWLSLKGPTPNVHANCEKAEAWADLHRKEFVVKEYNPRTYSWDKTWG